MSEPQPTAAKLAAIAAPVPPLDPQVLNRKGSLFLTRPSLTHYVAEHDELLTRARDVFALVGSGALSVRVGGRYRYAEAGRAHADLEGRRTTGKVLLVP